MELPDPVKIGARTYRFEPWTYEQSEACEKWGLCDHGKLVIWTCVEIDNKLIADTVTHELMHAIWNRMGIENVKPEHRDEEYVVNALAIGLVDMMHDSPGLLKWLQRALKA